ncbi:MAG: GNAT family N-acetyltransferase [Hyphomicrobiaceae bacterium]
MTQLALRDHTFGDVAVSSAPAMGVARATRPAALALPIELGLVTNFAQFEALEADWNALYAEAGKGAAVFQSFNWCWHWCRHYLNKASTGTTLAIVTGRLAGRLVLLMPFVTQHKAGLVELTWLGEPVSQYGDILATSEAAKLRSLEAAWRFAVARTGADVANLRRIRADSLAAPLMADLGAEITAVEDAPFLDLSKDRSFEGWETRRQPRARTNRRRQARRLANQGEVRFHALSGSDEAAALAAHAVRLKHQTLGDKGAISLTLADVRFERFFADAAHGLGRPTGVTVMALTSAGTPAALKIMIESKDTAFLHVAVFEPSFEKCGVGALLLEHVVERTIGSGRGELDLLPPRHTYKLDFADGVVIVRDYAVALSAKGWIYTKAYLRLRHKLKSGIEGLPKPLRRMIAKLAGGRSASSANHSAA